MVPFHPLVAARGRRRTELVRRLNTPCVSPSAGPTDAELDAIIDRSGATHPAAAAKPSTSIAAGSAAASGGGGAKGLQSPGKGGVLK